MDNNNSSNNNNKTPASTMPVPWDRLRAWIDAQERAEQQGYNPQPLTKVQLLALSQLVDFMDGPEPTVSDRDYVTLLTREHLQLRRLAPPLYQDLSPVEVPVDGVISLRWRTVCFLPSANHKEFPCEGYGLYKGQQPPLFKSKKVRPMLFSLLLHFYVSVLCAVKKKKA